MPKTPQPISSAPGGDFATVILDGSGNGIASLGPSRVREHWQLSAASVAVNQTPTKQAQCFLYIGSVLNNQNFVSQTVTGSSGDTCGLGGVDIQTGMRIWAKWVGGDAGQQATVTVIGTFTIGPPE